MSQQITATVVVKSEVAPAVATTRDSVKDTGRVKFGAGMMRF